MATILDINWTTATAGNGPWVATTGETWTRSGTASVGSGVLTIPAANNVNTPDQAGLAAGATTLDIRVELALTDWSPASLANIINQYQSGGASGSRFYFGVNSSAQLQYGFFNLAATNPSAVSSIVTGFTDGTNHGVRVLHDISAGTVDFYSSSDFTNWTPLGTQTTGLSTSPMDTGGTAPIVRLGNDTDGEQAPGTYTRTQLIITPNPPTQAGVNFLHRGGMVVNG